MPTENSVVASLNEVRRLERERVRREQEQQAQQARFEAEARAQREAEQRAWQDAHRSPHVAYDPALAAPGANSNGWAAPEGAERRTHRTYEMPAYAHGGGPRFDLPPEPIRHVEVKTRTSFTGVFFVAALLIGGGAFGYVQLQKDFQTRLMDVERARVTIEQQRNAALEEKDHDARQAKTTLAALEQKVAAMEAEAQRRQAELSKAQEIAPPAAAVDTGKRVSKARAEKKTFGRKAGRARKTEAVAEETPKPAKLKVRRPQSDDPLSGLKL